MRRVLALPLSTVERAGTGDLVSRTTADVAAMERTVRFAVPETLIAAVTTVLTVVAAVWVSPPAALACLAGVLPLVVGTRWYLRRAPAGYLWERAAYATLAGTVGETVEGGRTIEALGLREERVRRIDADLARAVPRRAAHALPAHGLVPDRRVRVRAARRGGARLGRLARLGRPRLDRRGDGDRALRRAARRPGRPAHLVAGRDPGRRDVVRAPRRHRRACHPTARRRTRRPEDEHLVAAGRALRVRRRAGRAARHRPRPRAGRARRRRRAVGRGQVDARPPARGHPPAARGRVDIGGVRLVDLPLEHAAPGGRARHAGAARLRRHARREPAARAAGRLGRAAARRTRGGRRARVGRRAAGRAAKPSSARAAIRSRPPRRSSSRSRGSCSPTRTRSCSTRRPRCSTRAPRATSSARSRPCSRPDRRRDRAPAAHRPRRRPRRRRRGRPAAGDRHARRARPHGSSYAALWDSWHGER